MRILLLALALVFGTGAATPSPDDGTATLAPDTEARWVAFTLTQANQIRFRVLLDGRPVEALLDTGASASTLSTRFALAAKLAPRPRGRVVAIGGEVATGWVGTSLLEFGGYARAGGGLYVIDLPARLTGNGGIDLIVGRDMLQPYALDIDYTGRRFRLLPSGRMPFTGTRAPLRIATVTALGSNATAPLAYMTRVAIAGREVTPVMVDTGDGTSLTLSRTIWRTLPLSPAPKRTSAIAYGAGGSVVYDLATLPTLSLGTRAIDDVEVNIEPSGGFSDVSRSAGRIGLGLLQRYRVLLDPTAGHLVLGDASAAPELPLRSTSGLQLVREGQALRVLHVMRGSPAALGGWRTGERICAVDGDPVDADLTWPFGAPGRTVMLSLCGAGIRTITLARFY